jgi:hypothetical protein
LAQFQIPEPGDLALAISESGRRVGLHRARNPGELWILDASLRRERTIELARCVADGVVRGVDGLALDDRGYVAAGIRMDEPPGQLRLVLVDPQGECLQLPVPDESFCPSYELRFFGANHLQVLDCWTARAFRFE